MAKTLAVTETPVTGIQQLKSLPARLSEFLKDVRSEMRKVISPSRAEVQSTTLVVLITVFVFAAYFWLVDTIIGRGDRSVAAQLDQALKQDRNFRQREQKEVEMREKGRTMAAEEQNPEEQNPQGESSAEQLAPPVNENFKWYIIHAYSGFERKVRESLESRIAAFGLQNNIGRIMIPTEPVTELRNGKKYTIDRVFLPGYVLVEMELDNDLWHVIKNTPRVTGFLGTGDNPVALSEQEVSSILFRSDAAKDKPTMKVKFDKGEQVRINEGPFANFTGAVDEINEDKQTLKVMVSIFGRSTPVEIEFSKVDKVVE